MGIDIFGKVSYLTRLHLDFQLLTCTHSFKDDIAWSGQKHVSVNNCHKCYRILLAFNFLSAAVNSISIRILLSTEAQSFISSRLRKHPKQISCSFRQQFLIQFDLIGAVCCSSKRLCNVINCVTFHILSQSEKITR